MNSTIVTQEAPVINLLEIAFIRGAFETPLSVFELQEAPRIKETRRAGDLVTYAEAISDEYDGGSDFIVDPMAIDEREERGMAEYLEPIVTSLAVATQEERIIATRGTVAWAEGID